MRLRKTKTDFRGYREEARGNKTPNPLIIVLWVCVIGVDLLAIRAESQKCMMAFFKKEGKKV